MDSLGDLDDLDSTLFGKPTTSKPTLSNLDALFGSSSSSNPPPQQQQPRRPAVSFLESNPRSESRPRLDDLFAEQSTSTVEPAPSRPASRPSRQKAEASSLSSLFGAKPAAPPATAVSLSAPPAVPAPVPPSDYSQPSAQDAARIQRLESEIERQNREIDDLKRKKKADEEDLEQLWKDKLSKKEADLRAEMEELRQSYQRQISKMEGEHREELERLKTTYDRQLDSLQVAAGQSREITSVVDKVDNLSATLDRLAVDMISSSEKKLSDLDTTLKLREQAVEHRENRLKEENERFQEEKLKVYELNAKLQELCKEQGGILEQDKWTVRNEWNRLNAEKQIFKEEQKYIMNAMDQQKESLEKTKASFLKEQHDLLVRVSAERTSLEHEKREFLSRRNMDVRRLKEEATELQHRIETVQAAETHAEELRRHFEAKLAQLHDIEISLTEECVAMEKLRETLVQQKEDEEMPHHSKRSNPSTGGRTRVISPTQIPKRHHSVRTNLLRHSEFLEKYIGQKVAAVSPQNYISQVSRHDLLN